MSRVALVLNGLVLTMVGVSTLSLPAAMLANFEVDLPSAMALAHARSIQGGGFVALATLMWLGLLRPNLRMTALRVAAFVMWGFALGRLVGIVVDGATDSSTVFGTVVEVLLGSLAAAALMREGPATSDSGPQ